MHGKLNVTRGVLRKLSNLDFTIFVTPIENSSIWKELVEQRILLISMNQEKIRRTRSWMPHSKKGTKMLPRKKGRRRSFAWPPKSSS